MLLLREVLSYSLTTNKVWILQNMQRLARKIEELVGPKESVQILQEKLPKEPLRVEIGKDLKIQCMK
jgi:hypothetical protein